MIDVAPSTSVCLRLIMQIHNLSSGVCQIITTRNAITKSIEQRVAAPKYRTITEKAYQIARTFEGDGETSEWLWAELMGYKKEPLPAHRKLSKNRKVTDSVSILEFYLQSEPLDSPIRLPSKVILTGTEIKLLLDYHLSSIIEFISTGINKEFKTISNSSVIGSAISPDSLFESAQLAQIEDFEKEIINKKLK